MTFTIKGKKYKMQVYPCDLFATITDGQKIIEVKNWKRWTIKQFCSKVEKLFN